MIDVVVVVVFVVVVVAVTVVAVDFDQSPIVTLLSFKFVLNKKLPGGLRDLMDSMQCLYRVTEPITMRKFN